MDVRPDIGVPAEPVAGREEREDASADRELNLRELAMALGDEAAAPAARRPPRRRRRGRRSRPHHRSRKRSLICQRNDNRKTGCITAPGR